MRIRFSNRVKHMVVKAWLLCASKHAWVYIHTPYPAPEADHAAGQGTLHSHRSLATNETFLVFRRAQIMHAIHAENCLPNGMPSGKFSLKIESFAPRKNVT